MDNMKPSYRAEMLFIDYLTTLYEWCMNDDIPNQRVNKEGCWNNKFDPVSEISSPLYHWVPKCTPWSPTEPQGVSKGSTHIFCNDAFLFYRVLELLMLCLYEECQFFKLCNALNWHCRLQTVFM
jgi:hypothetical protein